MSDWVGMPEFVQEKEEPYKLLMCEIKGRDVRIRFKNKKDYDTFNSITKLNLPKKVTRFSCPSSEILGKLLDQTITDKTLSVWYPFQSHWGGVTKEWVGGEHPEYPLYVVSKGRWTNCITSKSLYRMGVKHYIVVEESERDLYSEHTNGNIIVLPQKYLDDYDTCDDLGDSKSKGPGAARNFCIDHSAENGFKRHWVLDDNFETFNRLNRNHKYDITSGACFLAAEHFIDRYSNVPVAGMNYSGLCKKTDKVPAYVANTRIYSCLLIENASGYRWRGRYNEDTDLSLRVLKDGLCTIQFNAFLAGKVTTQRMRGGNSKEFYDAEGTKPKSVMLRDLHPDVSKVVKKFGRIHHQVSYAKFKNNKFKLVDPSIQYDNINTYGMKLVDKL